MTQQARGPRVHERWAHLRFSVIGQLLAAPPTKGELKAAIEALAERTWRHPTTGEPVRFGFSTIERWYYRALKERSDPVGRLRRKLRSDAGQQPAMSDAVRQAVLAQYAAHKGWSAKLHHDNLVALAETKPDLKPVPSYPTLRRFMKANGLDKRRRITPHRTDGAERAEARITDREVRSYEAEYVNGLWHWDCHHGSRKVLTARGDWHTPILFGVLDDRSRLACHLQWYLAETAEVIAHGLAQAFQKRGLPRSALSDNGAAMTAAEITQGLTRLGILHQTTLPYSPYQNAKQEAFWGPVEGRLIAMLEDVPDLTLPILNEATQAWVEHDYNRKLHSEIGEALITRFLAGPKVTRPCPDSDILRLAFTRSDHRMQRKSDGTVVIEGRRFEIPNRYRHLARIEVRYAGWDLGLIHLVDERTGMVLARLYPQDKLPLFVLTISEGPGDSNQPLLNASALARAVLGIGHVVILPAAFTWALTARFGRQRSVFGGAVRTYLPGFAEDVSPYGHRLFLAEHIASPEGAAHCVRWMRCLAATESIRRTRLGDEVISFGTIRNAALEFKQQQLEQEGASDTQKLDAANARIIALEEERKFIEDLQNVLSDDVQPVFAALLEKAVRICDATFGSIFRYDGDAFHLVATLNTPPALAEARKGSLLRPSPNGPFDRMLKTKKVVHVADLAAEKAYTEQRHPSIVAAVELGGVRTILFVPLLRGDELIGIFALQRQEVRPFTDKQIALVENFAAQAVIAIENARLLNELRQRTADLTERTADLTEALEQQTATSEVLSIISSSPGELAPVFDGMLRNATKLCEATFGALWLREGDGFRIGASHLPTSTYPIFQPGTTFTLRDNPDVALARMVETRAVIHIADLRTDQSYIGRNARIVPFVETAGARAFLGVPLLKDNEVIGAFVIFRQEERPFTDKQVALLQNFAAQAVIAIENARLLSELRRRTADLTESLEQQTATSEVLQVIGSSPGDLEPVFATMLESAVRVCDANFGNIYRWDGDALHLVATRNTPPAFAEARRYSLANRPSPKTVTGRMLATKEVVHVVDATAEPEYGDKSDPGAVAAVELGGVRTILAVPMWKEDELIGSFTVYRQEVRPFTEKQIELVQNFAAQAVIAIENMRLLNELRERTQQVEAQALELTKLNQQLEQRVADQIGEIERMGRLRRFLPPQVADLIVASGTEKQLESHRREITALFCDLRGFTGFSETADPEDVMALLREYHAAIGEIIIKYSGTLERYAGDGVMVVFNDPVPVPEPALQAVQAALDMRAAIGALTEKWSRLGHDLGFGVGIAHGHATLGTIGFEGRFDYAAIGTVSNVASRLCDEAKSGQILISPRVLMAVEDSVTVESVGEFELKGIRRPIAAYNVVAALPPSP